MGMRVTEKYRDKIAVQGYRLRKDDHGGIQ